MTIRKDAKLKKYENGGYCLELADGSEYEADTVQDAMRFAYLEGYTRVYSAAKPDNFVGNYPLTTYCLSAIL